MPHYVLDVRTATPHFPGIGRYTASLATAIARQLAPDERLTLIQQPEHPFDAPLPAGVRVASAAVSPQSLAQQWAIPRLLRQQAADLYHSPYLLMPHRPGVRTVLTVYDLIPLRHPEHSTARARLLFRWMMGMALRAAQAIIAISEATRRDLIAAFGVPAPRIRTIPLAAGPAFRPAPPESIAEIRARYRLPETYVLYLGSNKPHKNLSRLVESWHAASTGPRTVGQAPADCTGLVIAGVWDPRVREARSRAEDRQTPRIQWLGPVPEADLAALYSAATAFVFPSLCEGFGLPVLEAMACGVPVLCTNASSLPEVTGDAALLFDPTDAGELAESLRRILDDAALRRTLSRKGIARAALFDWDRTAGATLDLYRQA